MSFDSKKIKASKFTLTGWSADDHSSALKKASVRIAKQLDTVTEEPDVGWTSGMDELNTELKDENSRVCEYIFLNMRMAVRKVPHTMANALFRKRINEYMNRNHVNFVPAKKRKEIKEEVKSFLLQRTMPTMKAVWVIIKPDGVVYAGTSSKNEQEQLIQLLSITFNKEIIKNDFLFLLNAENAAEKITTMFNVPELAFLTELFRKTDTKKAKDFVINPPFDFVSVDKESLCKRSLSTGDLSINSNEVRTALAEKKLLKKAKLTVYNLPGFKENDLWSFTLQYDNSLSGLELPECEEMEFSANFAERVRMIDAIFQWILTQQEDFIHSVDASYSEDFHKWISER